MTTRPDSEPSSDGHPHPPQKNAFFTWLRELGIVRGSDRWFAGVAGGIAAKAGVDPLLIRGAFVVLALIGGPGVLLYLAGWLLLPDASGRIHAEEIIRGRASTGMIVTAVVLVAVIIIPGILGASIGGFTGLNIWGWGIWNQIGAPDWLVTTLTWLVWIALIVGAGLWIRRIVLNRGREQNAQRTDTSEGPSFAAQAEASAKRFGEQAEESARRLSEQAAAWGEQAATRATSWSEDVGKQATDWSARYAAEHDARQLGTAHTILTLALALLVGGITTAWCIHNGLGASTPLPLPGAFIAGMIAAVAVLAVSLIIAGIRGKRTGWIGFLSACGVIALLVTVVLPWGTRFQPLGTVHVDSVSAPGVALLAGTSEVDLSDLPVTASGTELEIWQLAGTSELQLPEDLPAVVHVRVLAGAVTESGDSEADRSVGGPFIVQTITSGVTDSSGGTTADAAIDPVQITVTLGGGSVQVTHPDSPPPTRSISHSAEESKTSTTEHEAAEAAAEEARITKLEDSIARLEWELSEPGLSAASERSLQRELAQLEDELATHEQEMAR